MNHELILVAHPARPVDLDGVLEERQYSNNVKLLKLLAFVNCCYCQNVMVGNDYSLQTIRQTHMQSERARGEAVIMTSISFYLSNRRRVFVHPFY